MTQVGTLDHVVRQLLECTCEALTLPACTCCAVAGPPVADRCCDEGECVGQLTANVVSVFNVDADTLSRVAGAVTPCRPGYLAADIAIVLARCHPTIDAAGEPPCCEELDAAAVQLHTDIQELWQALTCCPGVTLRMDSIGVQPGDPSGGCVAIVARVTALLPQRVDA